MARADGLLRVMQTLPSREALVPPGQPPLLPPAHWGRPTLLLDLDQTLIRSCPVPEGQALPVRMCCPSRMHAVVHSEALLRPLLAISHCRVVKRRCMRVRCSHRK